MSCGSSVKQNFSKNGFEKENEVGKVWKLRSGLLNLPWQREKHAMKGEKMKEMLEEYGGVVAACFLGISLVGVVAELIGAGGGLSDLVRVFAGGIGAV